MRWVGKGDKLAVRDKRRLLAMLQYEEAAAAKALKLDKKLWEPSPFPAEIKYPELRVLSRDGTIAEE